MLAIQTKSVSGQYNAESQEGFISPFINTNTMPVYTIGMDMELNLKVSIIPTEVIYSMQAD